MMKTTDEREMQKTKEKQAKAERSNGNRNDSERVRANLGEPQIITFITIDHNIIVFYFYCMVVR